MLSLIVAIDGNNGVGKNNRLPWKLSDDLKWFKENTENKIVVMGSNTYFSLPISKRPLPNRTNLVLTNDDTKAEIIRLDGANTIKFEEVLKLSETSDVFIIGGAKIYAQFLQYCDRLYITEIEAVFECDSFFPKFNKNDYDIIYNSALKSDDDNIIKFRFNIYKKK